MDKGVLRTSLIDIAFKEFVAKIIQADIDVAALIILVRFTDDMVASKSTMSANDTIITLQDYISEITKTCTN